MRVIVAAIAAFVLLAASASAADTPLIPSALGAGSFDVRKISEAATTITYGWDTVAGADGFDFYVLDRRVSHTRDGSRTTVKFGKVDGCSEECFGIEPWSKTVIGRANVPAKPTPPPPPPPTGWPDATNTGVPSGTTLTAYTGPSQITVAGTVIDAKTIGCITVEAANVKITRSRITCTGFYALRVANTNANASLVVEDTELSCNGANGHGFGERNITLRRVNLHHCENGLTVQDDVSVYDSYIHDLTMANDAHADGMQFEEAANNVNIVHNTIFGMGSNGQFGTSSLIADLPGHSNWLIENNLFGGGAFTVYCVAGKGTNWIIRNNAFTNRFSQAAGRGNNIGYFGHSNQCGDETQSGNYILETGEQIRLG